jgi:hypothetical protein
MHREDEIGPARSRRRTGWLLIGGALFLALLIALFALLRSPEPPDDARPALWRIEKAGRHGWLFGTIHAVPHGARWLSPTISRAAAESDWLWLEVTGLGDEQRSFAIFDRLGRSSGLPPLGDRLNPADRARLARLSAHDAGLTHGLGDYEDWAAALLINARIGAGGQFSSRNAGEAVFSALFAAKGKPAAGLETIAGQLGFFDTLPVQDQRVLLGQAISEADGSQAQLARLYERWAAGDLDTLSRLFDASMGPSPTLRAVLVDARNARWAMQIDGVMARHSAVPFIAVGVGHLMGAGSLQSRLEARGWRITRVQ